MNIVLIGFKNCGKTSVGQLIAEKLNRPFIDTDRLIEKHYLANTQLPRSVREIFQMEGENFFRALEKEAIASLIHIHSSVIATGGGSLLDSDNVSLLKTLGPLVYLHAPYDILTQRNSSQLFPAFLDENNYQFRQLMYKKTADYQINTSNKSINEIAEAIIVENYDGE